MRLIPLMAEAALLGMTAVPAAAEAQAQAQAPALVIDGAVAHGGTLDAGRLARLPQLSLPVTSGAGGGRSDRGQGVLLWDVLRQADPVEQPVKNPSLRHTVLVTGRDGYAVAFSFGELDPDGGADAVMLTTRSGALQLLVPGDRTRTRNVHDVVRVTVQ